MSIESVANDVVIIVVVGLMGILGLAGVSISVYSVWDVVHSEFEDRRAERNAKRANEEETRQIRIRALERELGIGSEPDTLQRDRPDAGPNRPLWR